MSTTSEGEHSAATTCSPCIPADLQQQQCNDPVLCQLHEELSKEETGKSPPQGSAMPLSANLVPARSQRWGDMLQVYSGTNHGYYHSFSHSSSIASNSHCPTSCACGLWQLCLHKLGLCSFSAFFHVTLVTHVTPRDVHVPGLPQLITSRHRLGMSHLVQDVEAKQQVRYRSR